MMTFNMLYQRRLRRTTAPACLLLMILIVAQCTTLRAESTPTVAVAVATSNDSGAPAGLTDRNARYLLQPSDTLELNYRYTPEFNQTLGIQPDGFVTLMLIGDLKLGGLTLEHARALIIEKSSARLRDPELTLVLREFVKPHFFVAGEVTSPGRFELRGRVSAVEAVAMAGGLKISAKHSQAILYRKVNAEIAEAKLVNLKQIAKVKGIHEDLDVRPGDLLFVPQSRISKIERFVKWGTFGIWINPLVH